MIDWGCRTWLMGVINVTPDSFSDGGRFDRPQAAVRQARRLLEAGVDVLDLGAQSTRPGAVACTAEQEWQRLAPVLEAIQAACAQGLNTIELAREHGGQGLSFSCKLRAFEEIAKADFADVLGVALRGDV